MTSLKMTRRRTLVGLGGLAVAGCASDARPDPRIDACEKLEMRVGGRLGVSLLTSWGSVSFRGAERFGMCSTFKLPLAAVILREIDAGRLAFDQWVPYSRDDLVPYAPVAEASLDKGGMTVGALAEATQVTSDNVAANLLLKLIGGPSGFTEKLRELGDEATRLDRYEPKMNFVPAGEMRDTTTPAAMAKLITSIFDGDALTPTSRELLSTWTIDTRTGLDRIRKGLPGGWRAGDKTGTASAPGMPNKHNDVAIVWRPEGLAVIAAYYEAPGSFEKIRAEDNAVLAEVGRIAADWLA